MTVNVVAGLRDSDDFATDERPKNFREAILWRMPNGTAPLTALLARMKTEAVDDPEFAWYDEPNDIVRLQLNGLNATTDTSFAIDSTDPDATNPEFNWGSAQHLVAGDVLQVESGDVDGYTNELVVVSSVTNDTTFVVKRGQCGTTAATIPDNTFLTKIASAFEEGSAAPTATSRNPTKYFNYCQIFKTTYNITNTTLKTRYRTGDPLRNEKKRKMFDHSRDLEQAFLWGKRAETTGTDGHPLRYCHGLRSYIPASRSHIFSTTVTVDTFLDNTYRLWDYDTGAGDERIAFAGNVALNTLNQIARAAGQIQYVEEVRLFGMRLSRWRIPQGSLLIRTHPLMNRHALYQSSMFIIDPTSIIYRPLRDTTFKDNVQAPDEDRRRGQWLTEAGIEVQYAGLTNGYLGNMTNP